MDKIKEFAEKCKIVTTITIVYKELYGRLIEKKHAKIPSDCSNLEELKIS